MAYLPKIIQSDPWLKPHKDVILKRIRLAMEKEKQLCGNKTLRDFATGHLYYGLHQEPDHWVFREWAPNATKIYLVGEFNHWKITSEFQLEKIKNGNWEIRLPLDKISHMQQYQLFVEWDGGGAYRLPSYGNRMLQDPETKIFNAQIWNPLFPYEWKNKTPESSEPPLIYEVHVGMSSEYEKVASYKEFEENILPYIKQSGYNTIQLMAVQEHPYYGSFGYHVSNFFAVSSRFGTPDDLKSLIDKAHGIGIKVIMDLVHSHAVKNEAEGLCKFDGTGYQYFHDNHRRMHVAWDSLCFNYSKEQVIHFLLSNCQYWLDEFHFDGFRFDGVTSMLYLDHGLGRNFTDYELYFDGQQDEDAITYLTLANKLIHEIHPNSITIAEEMSGMPGIAAPVEDGGYGFDYRLAMGVPDFWIKLVKDIPDEQWNVSQIFHELSSHRIEEKTISYTESHDQALVGDKTLFFRLADKEMYFQMDIHSKNLVIDRALALHKISRLLTISTSGGGYLAFMGNEFGHPEWIDFPREGNNWSYKYARRQWKLENDPNLKYHFLSKFDREMLTVFKEYPFFIESFPKLLLSQEKDQIIAFYRDGLLFVFNFNPFQSFTDYCIHCEPGKYRIVLSTDEGRFGGFDRVDTQQLYYTTSDGTINTFKENSLMLYLPARTGLVFKKYEIRKVY